jgi:hypothetical protein
MDLCRYVLACLGKILLRTETSQIVGFKLFLHAVLRTLAPTDVSNKIGRQDLGRIGGYSLHKSSLPQAPAIDNNISGGG